MRIAGYGGGIVEGLLYILESWESFPLEENKRQFFVFIVKGIINDTVWLQLDLRDTQGFRFYWNLAANRAKGKRTPMPMHE